MPFSESHMPNSILFIVVFFRVESEGNHFRLLTSGFSGNVSYDALTSMHHGEPFSTYDKDHDSLEGGSCASNNGGGWWYKKCHKATLTATYPTNSDRNSRTIRWFRPNGWLVLNNIIMKIRPTNYGQRFSTLADGEWLRNYYCVEYHTGHSLKNIKDLSIRNIFTFCYL